MIRNKLKIKEEKRYKDTVYSKAINTYYNTSRLK